MTENCACGAAIKTWSIKWWLYWREHHTCPNSNEQVLSVTEVDPIGFQVNDLPGIKNPVERINRGH